MDELPPEVGRRVRALMRLWLTRRINIVASTTVVMGMMIRDVLHECTLTPPSETVEAESQRLAAEIQRDIEVFLNRVHRADHYAVQPWLLHQSLLMATRVDEMDFDRIPMEDHELRQREQFT